MKRLLAVMIAVLVVLGTVHANTQVRCEPIPKPNPKPQPQPGDINISNNSSSSSSSYSDATSDSFSSSKATINTSTVSNYDTRTEAPTVFPPYLPYWNHGGWGTIKAYFSNGPSKDDRVYERRFDPGNSTDMKELRGVLQSLPYDGPIEFVGGFLNTVGAVFCGIDNYHHGRGFEIANSLVRQRRRSGKPLVVFIDTNVDTNLLRKAGYAYAGKVSIEGNVNRNWDQVYDAAVAETLPWDVDILLVSGGMKGVTVGSTGAFPGAGGAYSQSNYAISMFGSVSQGITEGKGKATLSAEGYRFSPEALNRTRVPQSLYNRIRASVNAAPAPAPTPTYRSMEQARITAPRAMRSQQEFAPVQMAPSASLSPSKRAIIRASAAQKPVTPTIKKNVAGVEVSRKLWEMAEFDKDEMVEYVIIR